MAPKKACSKPASRRPLSLSPLQTSSPAGSTCLQRGARIAGMQAAGEEHRNAHGVADLPAVLPVVHAPGPAQLLHGELRVAGIEEQRIDERRGGPRFVDRLGPGDVDHLDDARVRQEPAQAPQLRFLDAVDELHGGRAAAPLLLGDGLGLHERGQEECLRRSRHARGDARDLVFRNRAGAARHRRHEADGGGAGRDREPRFVEIRDAADLHEHVRQPGRITPRCSNSGRSRGSGAARRRSAGPSAPP